MSRRALGRPAFVFSVDSIPPGGNVDSMHFKNPLSVVIGLWLTMTFYPVIARAAEAPPTRPNIIFILTDDFGWGDDGVLFQNSRKARGLPAESTPNLDALAAQGAEFHDHYCPAPVCAPSRASLMAGVTQGHANIRDNQFDKAIENNHTLATVLRQAGYETIAVGKWGLQGQGGGQTNPATWRAYPTKRGFDYFFGYARHKDGHEHYPKEGLYDGPKQVWDGTTDISASLDKCYTADLWTAWTKQWIANHERTNSARPFFIYLAYDTPHAVTEYPATAYPAGGGLAGGMQWLGTPGHMINTAMGKVDSYADPLYASTTWPDIDKRYATAITRIDHAVGDLRQLLRDLNIESNTFVVFASDNGPAAAGEFEVTGEHFVPTFFSSYGPFDGIKRDCWEGGVRTPTFACWPGHIPAGKIITRPSALYDWLPTFADLAGVPPPARADGVSLLPELTNTGSQRDRGYVYVEYFEHNRTPNYKEFAPAHRGRVRKQMQVIRLGDYLGVRYDIQSQADNFEIYNVPTDPEETNNLATQMPALEQRMKDMVLQVRRPNPSAPRPYDKELVPAVAVPALTAGLEWKAYTGHFPWVPDFEALTPTATGTALNLDVSKALPGDAAGVLFSGYLDVPKNGDYTFQLQTDTGALLRIHDAVVIDADFGYARGKEISATIKLQAGRHPFRLFYRHGAKAKPLLNLAWSGPGIEEQPIPNSAFERAKQ
jgi:arylsulfatase A-like enzyme